MVDDVRPRLDAATVFVCPLLSGAGIKNKILQAWAMEKAVVATARSLGGLRAVPEENVLVADGRRAFADAVLRALADEELRQRLGRNGRATVLEHYAWESKAEQMDAVLHRVAGRGPAQDTGRSAPQSAVRS
jgi:glycosyltransferase involved in cell wall biosynthesis